MIGMTEFICIINYHIIVQFHSLKKEHFAKY